MWCQGLCHSVGAPITLFMVQQVQPIRSSVMLQQYWLPGHDKLQKSVPASIRNAVTLNSLRQVFRPWSSELPRPAPFDHCTVTRLHSCCYRSKAACFPAVEVRAAPEHLFYVPVTAISLLLCVQAHRHSRMRTMMIHIARIVVLLTVVICCRSVTVVPVREAVRMLTAMPRFVY